MRGFILNMGLGKNIKYTFTPVVNWKNHCLTERMDISMQE